MVLCRGPTAGAMKMRSPRGFEQIEALLVRDLTVIEEIDLMRERRFDRYRGAHVCGDALAVRVRRTSGRTDFVVTHDGMVRTRARDGLIAGDVELQGVDAFAQQQPARPRHIRPAPSTTIAIDSR